MSDQLEPPSEATSPLPNSGRQIAGQPMPANPAAAGHIQPPAPQGYAPPTYGQQPPVQGYQQPQYIQQPLYVQSPVMNVVQVVPDKSVGTAYLLWLFLGFFGGHQFYLGKAGRGIGYLLTFGWLTVGTWIDLFTLPAQVREVNTQRRMGVR